MERFKKETKFLIYIGEIPKNKKTFVVDVNTKDLHVLGKIKWHGAWRKYCFSPEGETIFDKSCLMDVIGVIDELMEKRKKKKEA